MPKRKQLLRYASFILERFVKWKPFLFDPQGYDNYINTVKRYFNEVHATLGGTNVSGL